MSDWDKASDWVRTLVGCTIWFVVVLVGRQVVLSLRGVQDLGFAVDPMWRGAYPSGILWGQLFDVVFRFILVISVLSIGGQIKDVVSSTFPRLPRLRHLVPLALGATALAISFFALEPIVWPPLMWQGVGWAYTLVFWVAMAGILAIMAFEIARVLATKPQPAGGEAPATVAPASAVSAVSAPEPSPVQESRMRAIPRDLLRETSAGQSPGADRTPNPTTVAAPSPSPQANAIPATDEASSLLMEAERGERILRLARSVPGGSSRENLLTLLLQIEAEHEPYKALLVNFVTPPPDVKRTRLLAIPANRALEPTALEVLSRDEFDSWSRVTVGRSVILAEHSEQQWNSGSCAS